MELYYDEIASPIGMILLVADERALWALDFADTRERMMRLLKMRYSEVSLVRTRNPGGFSARVRAYLEGDLRALDAIPVDTGGTDFQRKVWRALRKVRSGRTSSYGALARRIGEPKAARAVGAANGRNPVALVLPCHRILGADGSLTGYAGGLQRKRWLLEHEGVDVAG
ncbi:MAG: methylated-DNA--[protein]-cysteine S-methyltransferase [bacterium]|nr:methylated-DNA--[protein]-cysteine S-methyltransferase [bacterium]